MDDYEKLRIAEQHDHYLHSILQSPLNVQARSLGDYKPSPIQRMKPIPTIIWMHPNADHGLPHTRYPNIICMPIDIPDHMVPTILLHETIHITQRLYPTLWKTIFTQWDMTPWDGPHELEIRINPDTIQAPFYIWKHRWVLFGIFTEKPRLDTIRMVWWDITKRKIKYTPPDNWIEFFGTIHAEHPYEISAYYLSSENHSPACRILRSVLEI